MVTCRDFKTICYVLDENAAHTPVLGLVKFHLDYINGNLSGLPDIYIHKLKRVQNVAA